MTVSTRFCKLTAVAGALALLAACADPMYQQPGYQNQPVYQDDGGVYGQSGNQAREGRVTNVERIRRGGGSGGVVGTVAGGAAGGLIGHQVGKGSGRTAATIAGAIGGALIGRALEGNYSQHGQSDYYRVTVQFDNGGVRSFDYADMPDIRIGDRVRAYGNQLYR